MRKTTIIAFVGLILAACHNQTEETFEVLTPQPFNEVILKDNFWLPRLKTQAEVLVPFALEKTEPAVENLRRTGSFLKGIEDELPFPHRFVSSDLYKVMEGVAYILMIEENPALEQKMDSIIDIIADAQQEDGYLYVAHITGVSKGLSGSGMGDQPYSYVLHSHELYNVGHMYEAAVAYFQATGKRKWLEVAEKNAQHINRVFFEGDPNYNDGKPVNQAPGHQEIELGLIKLYRVTGNPLYLEMSKKFLDIRGVTYKPDGETGVMTDEYAQQHLPVKDQRTAVGHAVRAGYLYAAMAENAALHEDTTYHEALESIWHNIVDTKMHITGGLGAVHGIEGFGLEYTLPNKDAYNETCAAVANVLFNYRMFLMTHDATYMDVAEVSLFNNALAGVNMDGNRFFYTNRLEVDLTQSINRSPWFGTACCPSNIARLMPQVSGYMYTYTSDEIYAALYAGSTTDIPFRGGTVRIDQQTDYPHAGEVDLKINLTDIEDSKFKMKLRIPAWARSEKFVPGELYSCTSLPGNKWSIRVNGRKVSAKLDKGFAVIHRKWKSGDRIELILPMDVRFVETIEKVEDNRNRMAVTRGPLVYCAEGVDQEKAVQAYVLSQVPAQEMISHQILDGKLSGVVQVQFPVQKFNGSDFETATLKLIPYYAWNNRPGGDGTMIVWIPRTTDLINPNLALGLQMPSDIEDITASNTYPNDHVMAIIDGQEPKASDDTKVLRWTNYPRKGQEDYIDITFKDPKTLKSISVYWYDDKGGVQLPEKWWLEGFDGNNWKTIKIYNTDSYAVLPDQYNLVHPAEPEPLKTIRIRIKGRENAATGILEARFEGL